VPFRVSAWLSLISIQLSFGGLSDAVVQWVAGRNDNSEPFLRKLLEDRRGLSDDSLANSLASIVATAAHFSAALAHIVDFYLDTTQHEAREEIIELATSQSAQADAKLLVFAQEALRLKPAITGIYRTARTNGQINPSTPVQPGQRIFVNLLKANKDVGVAFTLNLLELKECAGLPAVRAWYLRCRRARVRRMSPLP
jgi:linoleate 10R-lipoxygenase